MLLFEYRSVRYWSKEKAYWGPKKEIFLIREIDDGHHGGPRQWNPVNSWSWVSPRAPRVVMPSCNRLRRMRGRFHLGG